MCQNSRPDVMRKKPVYAKKMMTLINSNYILLPFLYICNASWQIVQQTLREKNVVAHRRCRKKNEWEYFFFFPSEFFWRKKVLRYIRTYPLTSTKMITFASKWKKEHTFCVRTLQLCNMDMEKSPTDRCSKQRPINKFLQSFVLSHITQQNGT